MAEDVKTGTRADEGQVNAGPDTTPTTQVAPVSSDGQPDAGQVDGTSQAAPQKTDEPTFFDPTQVSDELMPAYKNMQRAFTKGMQEISESKQKIKAYDAFSADPVTNLQNYARQYGYILSRADAVQQLQGQDQSGDWEPKSWDEVMERAEDRAYQRLKKEMEPVYNEVNDMRKQSIEQQLNDIDPTWRQYEDRMSQNLQTHPTLAKDATMLYRMSVPDEVWQAKATQEALRRLETKAKTTQASGNSTTTKKADTGMPDGPVTFDEAVAAAKRKLADEGIAPLAG